MGLDFVYFALKANRALAQESHFLVKQIVSLGFMISGPLLVAMFGVIVVDFLRENAQLRVFLVKNGIPRDFIPQLRAETILTQDDEEVIMSETTSKEKMNRLLDILHKRLPSIEPLVDVMEENASTYQEAIQIIQDNLTAAAPTREQTTTTLRKILKHVKNCYKSKFAKFKPMPFYDSPLFINDIWINLLLESKPASNGPQNFKEAILNALSDNHFVLLKGDPGMGKTMTQKRLAYDWATGNLPGYDFVLCARFRDMLKDSETILDLSLGWMQSKGYLLQQHVVWLRRHIGSMRSCQKKPKSKIKRLLKAFRKRKIHVLCILDGCDEAGADCAELQTLLKNDQIPFLSTAVIVTSRPLALEKVRCPVPILNFLPLDEAQIFDSITTYLLALKVHPAIVRRETDHLISKITEHKIDRLARMPLLLSCLVFLRDQISSDHVVDIYLKICQSLVNRQEEVQIKFKHKRLSDVCGKNPAISNLAQMCLSALCGDQIFRTGTVTFSDKDLARFGVNKDLWIKVGLLNGDREQGDMNAVYELPHLTFQEFLAAAALYQKLSVAGVQETDCEITQQLFDVVKPWTLEQVWTFVFEMVTRSQEGSNDPTNVILHFFLAWCKRRNVCLNSEQLFESLLRLLPKAKLETKKELAEWIRQIIMSYHTPSSLISFGHLPVYRINENAVFLSDLNIVVLMHKHRCSTDIAQTICQEGELSLCLMEENTVDYLLPTCQQVGCNTLKLLKIHVTEEPKLEQITQDVKGISIDCVYFSFKVMQSNIGLSPLFNRLMGYSLKTQKIVIESENELIIDDLQTLVSSDNLKEQIEYIELDGIQFPSNIDAEMFGEVMKSYVTLQSFKLNYSKMRGTELLKLIENLSNCPIDRLYLVNEHSLADPSIANRFVHLLMKFTKLEQLRLSYNHLSADSIDRLCESISQMENLKKIGLEDENVLFEHLESLKRSGLVVVG